MRALNSVPNEARIVVYAGKQPWAWRYSDHQHLASYAVIRKSALVNTNFTTPGVHLLSVRGNVDFADPSQVVFIGPGDSLDLRAKANRCCDYIWGMSDEPRRILMPPGATIIASSPTSVLARVRAR